jgi:hypothetical protein
MMLVVVFKFDYDHKVAQGFEQLYQNDDEEDAFVSWDVKLYKKIEKFLVKNGFLEVVDVPNQQEEDEDLESNSALNMQEDQQQEEISKPSQKEVQQQEEQVSKQVEEPKKVTE